MGRRLGSGLYVSLSEPVIPVHLPALLLQITREKGVDSDALLAGTGLRAEQFQHPDTHLNYGQIGLIVARALMLSGDAGLGLEFGLRIRPSHLREMGTALMCAATLREAVVTSVRYQKLLGSAFDIRLADYGNGLAMIASKAIPLGEIYCFNQESWLTAISRLPRFVLEREANALFVDFDYPPPPHAERYYQIFGDRVRFNQSCCQVIFPQELLSEPIPGNCPTYFRIATGQCEQTLNKNQLPESLPIRIRRIISAHLNNPLSAADVAKLLHLSERTLHRRLTELDTSFRQLVKEIKFETAAELLRESNLPISVIANRVGFSDASNFAKAFRDWAGVSPESYRNTEL